MSPERRGVHRHCFCLLQQRQVARRPLPASNVNIYIYLYTYKLDIYVYIYMRAIAPSTRAMQSAGCEGDFHAQVRQCQCHRLATSVPEPSKRPRRDASRRAAAPIAGSLTPKDSSGVDMSLERPIPVEPFATPSGETINVLKHDYGFRTGGSRLYDEHYGEVPSNIFSLVRPQHCQIRRHFCMCDSAAAMLTEPPPCSRHPEATINAFLLCDTVLHSW